MPLPWHWFHRKRYTGDMASRPLAFQPIVAALLAAVWFSAPAAAQQRPAPGPIFGPIPGPIPDLVPVQAGQTPQEREADLLDQLARAPDPQAASLIEAEIRAIWSRSGSAAVDLLWKRGRDALEAGDPEAAIEHFTAAIDHAPGFAEARVGRAAAYYLTNRAGPAIDDLREALVLNPRHWEAMQGFAVLLEEMGREQDALELWRRVHDMHPQNAEAEAAVNRLGMLLGGRTL